MKEIGLTLKETAIIYTLLPITQTLSSPIAGLIADRLGKYRDVLLVSIVMTILLTTALLYVPTIPADESYKEFEFMSFNLCTQNPTVTQECGIISPENDTDTTELNSCRLQCNETGYLNISQLVVLQTKIDPIANICEYRVTEIQLDNSTLMDMCSEESSTFIYNCSIICQDRNDTSLSSPTPSNSRYMTFYLYSVLRVVHNIFCAIGYTLVNSSALALTETNTNMGEYGRQRFV